MILIFGIIGNDVFERVIFWKLCSSNSFVLFHFSKKGKFGSILNDFNIWDN